MICTASIYSFHESVLVVFLRVDVQNPPVSLLRETYGEFIAEATARYIAHTVSIGGFHKIN